jgi:pimeloyl-ACP methyl ester carboxylesterase
MRPGPEGGLPAPTFAPAQALPPGRTVTVRSKDGIRLHTEIFGPEDGYPIVLAHGITCAIPVWAEQIIDLSNHYRVIAFDHRGHGHSDIPPHGSYSLDLLAADLDAVLEATLDPGEKAVIAGHSMGGIAITSWADRYRDKVAQRADAVALLNTSTGQLLEEIKLFKVPPRLAATRVHAARGILRSFGATRVPKSAERASRRFLTHLAVGADADPAIAEFVHDLFAATSPTGRGACVRMLADALGPDHIKLDGLTVPTLVIGSEKDRLLPLVASRRIADAAPNLAAFVELPGGHCAILERPHDVNKQLRLLIESVTQGS